MRRCQHPGCIESAGGRTSRFGKAPVYCPFHRGRAWTSWRARHVEAGVPKPGRVPRIDPRAERSETAIRCDLREQLREMFSKWILRGIS